MMTGYRPEYKFHFKCKQSRIHASTCRRNVMASQNSFESNDGNEAFEIFWRGIREQTTKQMSGERMRARRKR